MAGIDPKFYWLTLSLLALCTLVGLIVAYRFQREVSEDLAPPTEKDLFGPLEKAYYSGLMDEAEFLRIQASMARQKGEEPAPPPKPKASLGRALTTEVEVEGPPPESDPDEEPAAP